MLGYSAVRPVTLRANSLKTNVHTLKEQLRATGFQFCEVEWYSDALIMENCTEEDLRQTEQYQRGEFYLQSLSSMLPPLVLAPASGENVLDMTAAPGGKTTQLSALSGGQALITACEKDKIRFDRLKFNVTRQGAPRVNLLQTDASRLDEFFRFDKILLDAPCSGSGTIDLRYPVKISQKLVENSVILQKKLLTKALSVLKSGSLMVYSTCSVLPQENGGVLQEVLPRLGGKIVPIPNQFAGLPLLPSPQGTICVPPTELYEGFFVALIQKR